MKTENQILQVRPEWQPTKEQIYLLTEQIIQPVMDGNLEPLKAMALLKGIEEALSEAIDRMKPYILDELSKYKTGEMPSALGVEFKLMEARPTYDYTTCNDAELNRMMVVKNDIDAKVKSRQEFLRKLTKTEFITDTETGEIVEVHPPLKKSTTTFSTKFPE